MSYYHILIEVNDHISTIEQTRDIELFDIVDIQPYLYSILLPYFNEQMIELEEENESFEKPAFLGKEVTGDKKYYNSHLTRFPYKYWDK